MTLTMDQAIDQICPKVCSQCGQDLPRPGEECAGCGELPRLLRQEAAEQLSQPGELARMQAEHHRQEAQRLLGELGEQLLEADRLLHIDRLSQALAAAENELTAGVARRDQAGAALKEPRAAERQARRERADAVSARKDFELELRKAERYKKGAKAIVLARQALTLADEELAAKDAALASAQGAVRQAEATFTAAEAEVRRLAAVRDAASWRLANPGSLRFSMDSLNALAAPVRGIAIEVAKLRANKPDHRFTPQDLQNDTRIPFALGIAQELGEWAGTSASEELKGIEKGRKKAKDELDAKPGLRRGNSVDDMAIIPPGSRRIPGGVLPGSPNVVPDPGKPALAISQASAFSGGDTVYRHPARQ